MQAGVVGFGEMGAGWRNNGTVGWNRVAKVGTWTGGGSGTDILDLVPVTAYDEFGTSGTRTRDRGKA